MRKMQISIRILWILIMLTWNILMREIEKEPLKVDVWHFVAVIVLAALPVLAFFLGVLPLWIAILIKLPILLAAARLKNAISYNPRPSSL